MSRNCSDANSRLALALGLLALLAGCGREPTAAEKHAAEDRAIAQVNAAQTAKPPPQTIAPQAILFADIQKYDLFGGGCAFAPGGSMGAVLLTRAKAAYMKVEDGMVRFASDPGSAKLPLDTFSRYVGKEMALSLTRAGGDAGEATRWAGHLVVTDAFDQVIYEADGQVQCGA